MGGGIFALRRPRPYSRRWRGDRRPHKKKRRGTPRRYSLRDMEFLIKFFTRKKRKTSL